MTYKQSLFQKHIAQYEPADPMYENYQDKKGRTRRRRRVVPPGLSARDTKILKSVQRRAHYLDKGMSLCGFRVGWTFWIGLVPGAGDVADAALNYFLVVRKARKAEIPDWLLQRMLINNAISAGIGFIPILGDIALATFKANSRNAALLEEFMRVRGVQFIQNSPQPGVLPGAGVVHGEEVPGKGKIGGGFLSNLLPHAKQTHAAGPVSAQPMAMAAGPATVRAPALPPRKA